MTNLLRLLGLLIILGVSLLLLNPAKSIFFLFGLIVIVISSFGLGYFTYLYQQVEDYMELLKDKLGE